MFSFRICMSILYIHVYTHILSPGMIWDDPTSSARLPKWSNVTARQITHHYHFFWEDFWRFLSCMDLYGIFGGNQYQLPVPTSWHFFLGKMLEDFCRVQLGSGCVSNIQLTWICLSTNLWGVWLILSIVRRNRLHDLAFETCLIF